MLDLCHGRGCCDWISSGEVRRERRLYDHHAERVGEHVVELSRDAPALGGGRALDVQFLLQPCALSLRREPARSLECLSKRNADEPRPNGEREHEHDIRCHLSSNRRVERQQRDRGEDACKAPCRARSRSVPARGEVRECSDRDPRGQLVCREANQPGADDDRRDRKRHRQGKGASRAEQAGREPVGTDAHTAPWPSETASALPIRPRNAGSSTSLS
jgi:hypothetical protein